MKNETDFGTFIEKVIARETAPIAHEQHPALEILIDSLAGELSPDTQSKLAAHLATCPTCCDRFKMLKKTLQEEQAVLETRTRVPNLAELVQKRQPTGVGSQLRDWVYSLVHTPTVKPALTVAATALVTVGITLSVVIPLLRNPTMSTTDQLTTLTAQVEILENQLGLLIQGGFSIPDNFQITPVTAEELLRWNWQTLRSYTTKEGDHWESIASDLLGNRDLWPLVWLLNADKGLPPDGSLPSGEMIRLPTRSD